jgi:nicotinate phosphoribosyltransferase
MIDPLDFTRRRRFDASQDYEDLLVPVFRSGQCVYDKLDIHAIRTRVQAQLASLHPGVKRFVNPHSYPVGLERRLYDLKTALILKLREG